MTKKYWLLTAYVVGLGLYATGCVRVRGDVGTVKHRESCAHLAKTIVLLEEDARDQGVSSSCFGAGQAYGSATRYRSGASASVSSFAGSSCSSSSNATGAMKKRRKLMWIYAEGQCPAGLIVHMRAVSNL